MNNRRKLVIALGVGTLAAPYALAPESAIRTFRWMLNTT